MKRSERHHYFLEQIGGIMDNRTYGYARVSSREQNEDSQLEALNKFGVPEQNIIIDKASGKDTEREGYQYLKRQILRKGNAIKLSKHNSTQLVKPYASAFHL